jgi:hypothetical protein
MSLLTPRFRASIANLPSSPELVLIHMRDEIAEWRSEPSDASDSETAEQFVAFLRKFVLRHKLDVFVPTQTDENALAVAMDNLDQFCRDYQASIVDDELEELIESVTASGDAESFGYAHLNTSEKTRIHGNIERIRELIEASDLSDRKRNALYEKLNQLAAEVDRNGTKTDRFFAFMGDAAFVLGDMATKAKPFTDEVKDMIKTIGKARSRKEGTSLPPGEEVLTLPAPEERENDDAN